MYSREARRHGNSMGREDPKCPGKQGNILDMIAGPLYKRVLSLLPQSVLSLSSHLQWLFSHADRAAPLGARSLWSVNSSGRLSQWSDNSHVRYAEWTVCSSMADCEREHPKAPFGVRFLWSVNSSGRLSQWSDNSHVRYAEWTVCSSMADCEREHPKDLVGCAGYEQKLTSDLLSKFRRLAASRSFQVTDETGRFAVELNVSAFHPEELAVKVQDREVCIEGHHEERNDQHGRVERHFVQKFLLPTTALPDSVESIPKNSRQDRELRIEGHHEGRSDQHGSVERHFVQKFLLPMTALPDSVESSLSDGGVLRVTAQKNCTVEEVQSRKIPIQPLNN
ncbi:unnamed protein product [Gongylonema pulchrum]|uniref:SHSP domain-containing protein n=1 Tax=Gongylonema pulchrum TaxID=637853 RepID=A0A183ETY0_9BILA|nr:unnamed protein product [Gongylonema pulchrum]